MNAYNLKIKLRFVLTNGQQVLINSTKKEKKEPCYNSNEVAKLLGYNSNGALHNAIYRDKIVPLPTFIAGINRKNMMWRKSIIDKFIKQKKQVDIL